MVGPRAGISAAAIAGPMEGETGKPEVVEDSSTLRDGLGFMRQSCAKLHRSQ